MTHNKSRPYRDFLAAIRVRQWIKNLIIPGVGLVMMTSASPRAESLLHLVIAFLAFCIAASSVYLLNDMLDVAKDRAHPTKCRRPIAAGRLNMPFLWALIWIACPASLWLASLINFQVFSLLTAYLAINIGYCIKFKHVPNLDIVCVASGFTIRALIGAFCVGSRVNFWILATIIFTCMGLAAMKRMKELQSLGASGDTRPVLTRYTYETLQRIHDMFMVLAMLSVTIFLEHRGQENPLAIAVALTFISAVFLTFVHRVQGSTDGDPTNLIYKNKYLAGSVVLVMATLFFVI
jgi:decaprenyl-phosphate phosphoribosyltransferase